VDFQWSVEAKSAENRAANITQILRS